MPRIFSLSIHADYRCGRSGACCTAGWPIPVERDTHERLGRMIARGALTAPRDGGRTPGGHRPLFVAVADAPRETPVVTAYADDGVCAFYERGSGLCAIHRQAGPALLPVACRQFPRFSLADVRGVFVNLSHYCPTAARLLFRDDVPLGIVEEPAVFTPDFDYDPLDARDALPPLLRPGVLTSVRAFGLWERRVVALFAAETSAERALSQVTAFTEAVRAWTPGGAELERRIEEWGDEGGSAATSEPPAGLGTNRVERAWALVLDAVPAGLAASHIRTFGQSDFAALATAFDRWVAGAWPVFAAPVRRYLAAKVFGSWLAYQGHGLRTIVRSADVALSLLKAHAALMAEQAARCLDSDLLVEAIRRTDELIVHLASREALAHRVSQIESMAPSRS